MNSWKKRGQGAAGAAVFLAIVTGLIIAFIIAIPPDERAELLGEYQLNDGSSDGVRTITDNITSARVLDTVLQVSPGRIDFLAQDEVEHPLPVINVFTSTEAKVLAELNVAVLKNALFTNQEAELSFQIPQLSETNDLLITFQVEEAGAGELIVELNEQEIFNGPVQVGAAQPIRLPQNILQTNNLVTFRVSSPGLAFWQTHDMKLSAVKVVGDVTNRDAQSARSVFLVSETEANNLERARLKFQPDCVYNEVGPLTVVVNGVEIYRGLPDCALAFVPIEFSPELLVKGENEITFQTDRGRYLLSHVVIESQLDEVEFPTYYFDLAHDEYTALSSGEDHLRLRVSFVDDVDRKRGTVVFNGHAEPFDTKNDHEIFDLSEDVADGTNSLQIRPSGKSLNVREVRADIVE